MLTWRNTHTHTLRSQVRPQQTMEMRQHKSLNLKQTETCTKQRTSSSSTLGFLDFEPLQIEFFWGIKHEFHLNLGHCYLLHTHEPFIGSEYGVFHMNTKKWSTLKIKLNGVYSIIETQIKGINISES